MKVCYSYFWGEFGEIDFDLFFYIKGIYTKVERIVFEGSLKTVSYFPFDVKIYENKQEVKKAVYDFLCEFIFSSDLHKFPLIEKRKFYFFDEYNSKRYYSLLGTYYFGLDLYLCDKSLDYTLSPRCKYPNQVRYFPFLKRNWWWPWYIYQGEECCNFTNEFKNIKELLG